MIKLFIASFLTLTFLVGQVPLVLAQEATIEEEVVDVELIEEELLEEADTQPTVFADDPIGNLQCFDHYRFGSVTADIQGVSRSVVPGSTITFKGSITNENAYPLVDGTLSVKIFRENNETRVNGNGNSVVDQFVVKDNITIRGNATLPVSYEWSVPLNALPGEYYAAYYFTTQDSYSISGLIFSDDVTGGQSPFSVVDFGNAPTAELQKNGTTLNGEDYLFVAFPPLFEKNEIVVVNTSITNPTDKTKSIPLQWNQYAWDAQSESNLRNSKTELVTLAPGETKTVSYQAVGQAEAVVFITATAQDLQSKSILNIRYVREGIEEGNIAFTGLTKFPLAAGETTKLFSCAHRVTVDGAVMGADFDGGSGDGYVITTTLKSDTGEVLSSHVYEGILNGAVSGFGQDYTVDKPLNKAILETTLSLNGNVIESSSITYDCNLIDPNSCHNEIQSTSSTPYMKIILTIAILLLITILAYILFRKFKSRGPNIVAIFVLCLIGGALTLPSFAQAESRSVSGIVVNGAPTINWNGITINLTNGWRVDYHANVRNLDTGLIINDGDTIPVGTRIRVEPKPRPFTGNSTDDIEWFQYGSVIGTPEGYWTGPSNFCRSFDLYGGGFDAMSRYVSFYTPLSVPVVPEVISVGGVANTPLGGNEYRIDSAGTLNVNVEFPATTGRFNISGTSISEGIICGPADLSEFPISKVDIPFSFTASGALPPQDCTPEPAIRTDAANACASVPGFTGVVTDVVWDPDTSMYTVCVNDFPNTIFTDACGGGPLAPDGFSAATSQIADYTDPICNQILSACPAVPPPNSAPTAPTINAPITGTVGTSYYISFEDGVDPDGDDIRYGIDWTDDGIDNITDWAPSSGFIPSNTLGDINHSWGSVGTTTFRVQTWDDQGNRSGWSSHTIRINPAPLPTASLEINLSAGPIDVNAGDNLNIVWNSSAATSCTGYGPGFVTGGATSGSLTVPASSTHLYSLDCNNGVDNDTDSVQVNVNTSPVMGAITGDNVGIINEDLDFGFIATDADGDLLTFEIDWDNNGTFEDIQGTYASGISYDTVRQWASPSSPTYTIRAQARDSKGQPSNIVTRVITINPPAPPVITRFEVYSNPSNTIWGAGPITINATEAIRFRWNSTGADTCTGSASPAPATFDTSLATPPNTSNTGNYVSAGEPNPGTSATYRLTCNGPGGDVWQEITVTRNGRADYSMPVIRRTLSTGFDPVTGEYDSITIDFTTQNIGGSVANPGGAAPIYRARMDFAIDGSWDRGPVSGNIIRPMNTVVSGISPTSFSDSIVFTDIPFGTARIEVAADHKTGGYGRLREDREITANNNANTGVLDLTGANAIPPPDPGLTISANPTLVRSGETAVITWDTVATYPTLSCRVLGPGIDESALSGSETTSALFNKSEYTFSCTENTTNTTWSKSVAVEVTSQVEEI